MTRLIRKNYLGFCFLIFFVVGLFCLSINSAFAKLEVAYPTIANQTLTENTKLPDYIKYIFNISIFIGLIAVFASITVAGVMYFLSPIKAEWLANAKDRVFGALSGLLILILMYLVLVTINPQLSILSQNKLPPNSQPPEEKRASGLYFYKASSCSDENVSVNTSSLPDFGPQKNRIRGVEVVKNSEDNTSYISILYENTGLWGKCLYLDPNQTGCQTVEPFAASASIHRYNNKSNSDGVYFYRKTCFNKVEDEMNGVGDLADYCNENSGGYLKVSDSEIRRDSVYVGDLTQLKFTGSSTSGNCTAPEEERICISYDKNGKCTERDCPILGGENISSIIINGSYIVLFVYNAPEETNEEQQGEGDETLKYWTSCQEFPSQNDPDRLGPKQIKWENIRNDGGVIPNYVVIIPVEGN